MALVCLTFFLAPVSKSEHELGLVSQQLAPYALLIKGVDISQGLVDRYNQKFVENNKHLSAVRAELRGDFKELEGNKFDAIFVRIFI